MLHSSLASSDFKNDIFFSLQMFESEKKKTPGLDARSLVVEKVRDEHCLHPGIVLRFGPLQADEVLTSGNKRLVCCRSFWRASSEKVRWKFRLCRSRTNR